MTFLALVPPIYYNVKQYGCVIDGVTDDTAGLAAAMSAANSAGGGTVFVPAGTLITGNQTLYSNVHLLGAGIEATIIKLKNSTNADLLSASTGSINLSASFGSGSAGGIANWSIQNLTLDGNKANQSSGTCWGLRIYGYGYILQNVRVRNGRTGGILSDWNGGNTTPGQDQAEVQWANVKVHDNSGVGIQIGGPHDTQWSNVISYANGSHNVHIAPNARSLKFSNCRAYTPSTGVSAVSWLIEADSCTFSNCEGSGSDTCQVAWIASKLSWIGGSIYANPAGNVVGVQLGQNAGNAPFSGQINQSAGVTTAITCDVSMIETTFTECRTGAINEVNIGHNMIIGRVSQSSGSAIASNGGFASSNTAIWLVVSGLTPDGSDGKGGIFQAGRLISQDMLNTLDINGLTMVTLDTFDGIFVLANGYVFNGYSDNGSTQTYSLKTATGDIAISGNIADGQSASAAAIANAGTIITANIGEARVAPTGNVTGIILQAGTIPGQTVFVTNQSAFTITFNTTPATSNIAGSATDPAIPANGGRLFKWNSSNSLWYRAA